MPSLRNEKAPLPADTICAGCPVPIFTKMITRVTDGYEIVAGNATCGGVFHLSYSAWKIPWIHTAFENAGASMSRN
ncbi:MAG: hypothetical protein R2874_15210 [Desulfobacterales bacterium]